jgi:hypothetical protein
MILTSWPPTCTAYLKSSHSYYSFRSEIQWPRPDLRPRVLCDKVRVAALRSQRAASYQDVRWTQYQKDCCWSGEILQEGLSLKHLVIFFTVEFYYGNY